MIFQNDVISCDADASPQRLATLAQVCVSWYDCIMGNPTFWTTIRVVETLQTSSTSIERTIQRVKAILRLSKSLPLIVDIIVHSYILHDGEDNEFAYALPCFRIKLEELSRVLRSHADRILEFTLVVDECISARSITSGLINVPMSLLRKWDVRNIWAECEEIYATEPEVEENSHHVLLLDEASREQYPNLRIVSLHAVHMRWSEFSPDHLTRLDITMPSDDGSRPSLSALAQILRANSNSLESLTLLTAIRSNDKTPIPETISMRSLRFMALGFFHTSELIPLLSCVEVSSLKTFILSDHRRQAHGSFHSSDTDYDSGINQLFDVISKRFPLSQIWDVTLRHIAFCHGTLRQAVPPSNASLIEFLCSLTSLKVLLLDDPDVVTVRAFDAVENLKVISKEMPKPRWTQIPAKLPFMLDSFLWTRIENPEIHAALVSLNTSMPKHWHHFTQWRTAMNRRSTDPKVVSRSSGLLEVLREFEGDGIIPC
ncbi:hypothetical protein C0991_006140 [Blastosporella zonata]|nr:hypothetical protein C0991_006140 [Blastosporella zonata]